jgi:hypothetical protein
MVRHRYVVGNYLDRRFLQDVEYLVALQNQDVLNQDAVLTFQDVHLLHQLVVVVDEELRHLLKMDYCQDEVDAEERHLLKMDYCQDEEQLVRPELEEVLSMQQEPSLRGQLRPVLRRQLQRRLLLQLHVMP